MLVGVLPTSVSSFVVDSAVPPPVVSIGEHLNLNETKIASLQSFVSCWSSDVCEVGFGHLDSVLNLSASMRSGCK